MISYDMLVVAIIHPSSKFPFSSLSPSRPEWMVTKSQKGDRFDALKLFTEKPIKGGVTALHWPSNEDTRNNGQFVLLLWQNFNMISYHMFPKILSWLFIKRKIYQIVVYHSKYSS